MTIDEAIEMQEGVIKTLFFTLTLNERKALQLGIEALKEVRRLRSYKAFHVLKLLPGETE